jgi:hypothetical protein
VPIKRKKAATKPKPARAAKPRAARANKPAQPTLKNVVVDALADMKALDVKLLDVRGLTDIAD